MQTCSCFSRKVGSGKRYVSGGAILNCVAVGGEEGREGEGGQGGEATQVHDYPGP